MKWPLFAVMEGETGLLARLLFGTGTGMRLMGGMRLRVKDVEFDRHVIIIREAKGNQDRVVMLPRPHPPAGGGRYLFELTCVPAGEASRRGHRPRR